MDKNKIIVNDLSRYETDELRWNVVSGDKYKRTCNRVFGKVAKVLINTLGPYGSSTIIEEVGKDYAITKDGWNVIKNIHFNNVVEANILKILCDASYRMVAKVGDGSTSAIVAAYSFFRLFNQNTFNNARPKDVNDCIQDIVNKLCDIIQKNATRVTDENLYDIIYKTALVSTNHNEEFSKTITVIYKKLGKSVNITHQLSPTNKTYVENISGKYISRMQLLNNIFINNDNNTCEMDNPYILMFEHVLEARHFNMILSAYDNTAGTVGGRLVVIAPSYDQYILNKIQDFTHKQIKKYRESGRIGTVVPYPIVFVKSQLFSNHMSDMYRDLASLLGCTILDTDQTNNIASGLEEFYKKLALRDKILQSEDSGDYDSPAAKAIEEFNENGGLDYTAINELKACVGQCVHVSICSAKEHETAFSGFNNKDEVLYSSNMRDAELRLSDLRKQYEKIGVLNKDYYDAEERYNNLQCNSATIYVGGSNNLEKGMNNDAIDDAIKACSSTLTYGYNTGCNLAICFACLELMEEYEANTLPYMVLQAIYDAFLDVYSAIIQNSGVSIEIRDKIFNESFVHKQCYNLITNDFDNSVINSCKTDIEILKGTISILSILLVSNQYISKATVGTVKGED